MQVLIPGRFLAPLALLPRVEVGGFNTALHQAALRDAAHPRLSPEYRGEGRLRRVVVRGLSIALAIAIALCLTGLFNTSTLAADDRVGLEHFEAKIRPVLVKHCYACHSAEAASAGKLKAALQLDSKDGLRKGGESGALLSLDKPENSLLIKSLRHDKDAPEMPPNEKLSDAIIADFVTWIRLGAPDPREGKAAVVKRGMSVEDGRQWWSMKPPQRASVPVVKEVGWPRSTVDQFVLAKLEAQQLHPVADADRRTLIRRAYLDVIGLLPPVEKVDAFVQDSSNNAFVKVVDELLASPHFGERWGRHWLDAARYADSNGRDRNVLWYHAWHYRDYVIDSFKHDKPYDRFLQEQIAGDLLAQEITGNDPASRDLRDQLRVATGFLALGAKAFEEQKPEIFRMDVIDEQIEVIGRSILGLSIGCARCHDHKFDPIPTRDYYAIAGILRSTQPFYGHGPRGIKATSFHHTDLIAIGADAESLGPAGLEYFNRLHDLNLIQNTARSDRYRVVRKVADAKNQIQKPGADKEKLQADIDRMEADVKEWDIKVKAAENEFQALMDKTPTLPGFAMGARDRTTMEDCRIHIRGETTNLGDNVPRGALQVLPNGLAAMPTSQSGRKEFAQWLTARGNPLTARVFVNRVWQHLFGRGLVTTPDDYGVNGAKPTHPELLDDLSVRFMEQGWSTKTLIRELLLTRTYQLASEPNQDALKRDPDNVWLWRMSPRRLEVENLRDAVMTVSSSLDLRPPTTEQMVLQKLHPYREPEFHNFKPPFKPQDIDHAHRSIYLPVVRGVLPTMFALFDFAAPDRAVAQRDESTVPSQALYFMNNAWVIEHAQRTAKRVLQESELDDSGRVRWLFQRAFARLPDESEVQASLRYLESTEQLVTDPKAKTAPTTDQLREARWTSFCQAIFASAEFRTVR